jgi:type III pantothenate kinase
MEREPMLLAIDIGNTNVTVGAFDGRRLLADWRLQTDANRTPDEYGILLTALIRDAGREPDDVDAVWVGSVVPVLTRTIREAVSRRFGLTPEFITCATPTGIQLDVERPDEVGADRIVNAVAVTELYGAPAIVVDFGTATTFDVVLKGGVYVGGAILPGIQVSMNALFDRAALLSRVELRRPPNVVGRNTTTCVQSGFYYGFIGQVDNLIVEMTRELGETPRVVATGGLAPLIASESRRVDAVDPSLTLKGIQLIHERVSSPTSASSR